MPRCQRTLRALCGKSDATVWQCPQCPDAEQYELIGDDDLVHYGQVAVQAAIRDFGIPADVQQPTRLIRGLMPECVRTPRQGYDLYLGGGSDALQLRLQIGHEVFHRVCSQGQIFHWTHEMMACVFSVRLLRELGFGDYATQMDTVYRTQAELLPLADLLVADVALPPYPKGLYGRAYVTGDALGGAVGWTILGTLVRLPPGGRPTFPDTTRWQRALSVEDAQRVTTILTAKNL